MPEPEEALAECPSCGSAVALDAPECPQCGELFAEEVVEMPAEAAVKPEKRVGLREKLLFYLGVALILLGGPGIALGSWLHDVFRISVGEYDAFEAFGQVNRLVAAVGLIVLILGIVFLILSLRLSRPSDTDYDFGSARDA